MRFWGCSEMPAKRRGSTLGTDLPAFTCGSDVYETQSFGSRSHRTRGNRLPLGNV